MITVNSKSVLPYINTHPLIESTELSAICGHYVIPLSLMIADWPMVLESLKSGSTVAVEKTDEGIETLWHIIKNPTYYPWILKKSLRFITSSDADNVICNLNAEHFLRATIGSNSVSDIQYTDHRPYTFLFTNRKMRSHRRYLITTLRKSGLLDSALWSCLHQHSTQGHPEITRIYSPDTNMPLKTLDPAYDPAPTDWIDGIIHPLQYQHTWFTLVSETGFEYPYSFRTEKVWKPILAGHPFIVCANQGFYRDFRNLGFRTFNHLIDESFDSIIDGKERLDMLIATVKWLCNQDLQKFWKESRDICLYNQHRALELHNSLEKDFTLKFLDFMHA